MIYFIAYLIKGEARALHKEISSRLSREFRVKDPNSTAPPHLTIKAPFSSDNINEVDEVVREFTSGASKSKLKLDGFSNFGRNVIFVNVDASEEMIGEVRRLISQLKKIKGLEWKELEKWRGEINFHATLAKRDIQDKFDKIMESLGSVNFSFELDFDNIAILVHKEGKWHVYKEYEIK